MRIKIESERDNRVQVNLSQERSRALGLEKGPQVYVIPREMKAFLRGEAG